MENLVSMNDFISIYKGKKVFVTGHTGFKGAWLCACLHLSGALVKGYSLEPEYEKGLYDILEPRPFHYEIIADIRNRTVLARELHDFSPDFIFHLAAQPLVRRSYQQPAETFNVNVTGTANLLEAVRDLKNKCTIVIITTDKVYANKEDGIFYKESDPLGGYDPYSSSKACTELVVSSFRNSFFNTSEYQEHKKAIATARAGNVIGGGDWSADRIIPDIVRSLQNHKPVLVRNREAVRPWQHVIEPLRGYMMLGALLDNEPLRYSKAYNFGPLPHDHLSVENLVKIAIRSWGDGEWKDISDKSQPHEAGLLKLNIDLAKKDLDWNPKLSASAAIDWTIQWYKADNKSDFTYKQINDYFSL